MRKLVYSSVGDENSTFSWLCPERSYEVCVAYYGSGSFSGRDAVDYYLEHKGYKIPNFLECVRRYPELLDYDQYLFIDDDIVARPDTVERIFSMMEEYRLEISQPSLEGKGSEYSWPHLVHRENLILEYTNLVEIQCFCITQNLFKLITPYLPFIQTGYGLDLVVWELLGRPRDKMAVLHSLTVGHPSRKDGLRLYQRLPDWDVMCREVKTKLAKKMGKNDPRLRDKFEVLSFGNIRPSGVVKESIRHRGNLHALF